MYAGQTMCPYIVHLDKVMNNNANSIANARANKLVMKYSN